MTYWQGVRLLFGLTVSFVPLTALICPSVKVVLAFRVPETAGMAHLRATRPHDLGVTERGACWGVWRRLVQGMVELSRVSPQEIISACNQRVVITPKSMKGCGSTMELSVLGIPVCGDLIEKWKSFWCFPVQPFPVQDLPPKLLAQLPTSRDITPSDEFRDTFYLYGASDWRYYAQEDIASLPGYLRNELLRI